MAQGLRVGVIGAGSWTEICHIPGIQTHAHADVVALCSRSDARRQAQAEKFNVAATFADYRDLIARADVDAVTISTPNVSHYPAARAALLAGKHVFCEKPLTLHHGQSAELLKLAEAAGRVHHVAFTFRFLYAAHVAKRLLEAGTIGRLRRVLAVTEGAGALRPNAPPRWRDDASLSGYGMLGDMGSHLVDLTRFVSGGEFTAVRGATWRIDRAQRPDESGRPRPVTADEETDALCDLVCGKDVVAVALRVSKLTPPPHRNYVEFIGERGYLRLPYSRGNVDTVYLGRDGAPPEVVPLHREATVGPNHCLYKMMGAFVDACLGGAAPEPANRPATFADGHAAQKVLDAIAAAARSGAPAKIA